jgi:hypothetical protein
MPTAAGIRGRHFRVDRRPSLDVARGDVWTAASGPSYAGKPRPVVILQDGRFDAWSFSPWPDAAPHDAVYPIGRLGRHVPQNVTSNVFLSVFRC